MAFAAGYNAVLKLDATVGGSLTAYTAYAQDFNWSFATDLGEVSVLGSAWRAHIPLLKQLTFSLNYRSDPTFTAVVASHLNSQAVGSSITFELNPDGTGTGTLKLTGECWLGDASGDSAVDAVSGGSLSYTSTGAVTVTAN